jgi:putative phosphoesterase
LNLARIAFLSDIHGNLPALRAALAEARERGADRIIVAGDVVGTGPFPLESVQLLMTEPEIQAIRGNVDRQVLRVREKKPKKVKKRLSTGPKKRQNKAWSAVALDDAAASWLASLPPTLAFTVEGVDVLVVHGSPIGDSDYIFPSLTEEALARKLAPLSGPPPRVLVSGHSHIPFVSQVGGTLVINCGSVGKPADGDPRGSFALAELRKSRPPTAEIVRFAYPMDELQKAITDRDVPGVRFKGYREGLR